MDLSRQLLAADEDQSGYNKDKINALGDALNSAMEHIGTAIKEEIETELINKIGEKWYSKEAQDYFKVVKKEIGSSAEVIRGIFSQFRDSLQERGETWARATGNASPSIGSIKELVIDVSISPIKELREDGAAVLYEKDVNTIADNLDNVEKDLKAKIQKYKEELDASTAFIGHGQAQAISDCFDRILGEIHSMFQYLLVGDMSVKAALKAFKEKYKNKAENEREGFNNTQVNIDVKPQMNSGIQG